MMRKRSSFTILIIFSILLVSCVRNVSAQDNTWTQTEVTSNPGFEPTIDGEKDSEWAESGNITSYVLDGLQFKVYVQHYEDYLYFLVEARFITEAQSETVSLYLASNNKTADIFDKKQITLFNASQRGNESSSASDYYLTADEGYQRDSYDLGFTGAASIGSDNFRIYEFQIQLSPDENSTGQDANIRVYRNYAVQLGFNSSSSPTEKKSNTLLVQVGPKSSAQTEGEIGEYNFNTELYILIVLIIISVPVIGYGIAVFSSKQKVGVLYSAETEQGLEE